MQTKDPDKPSKSSSKYRWLRRLGRSMVAVVCILLALILFLRSEWGQSIMVNQLVNYVEDKTGTEVAIDKAFVTFSGGIQIEGLYLEDLGGDTLLYSNKLEAKIPLVPIIQGKGYALEWAEWDGLVARVKRQDSLAGFNYQFLIDAFTTTDSTSTSTAAPLELSLGMVELTDFDIIYTDDVANLDALIRFDRFFIEMNQLDLSRSLIDIDVVELSNAVIDYNNLQETAIEPSDVNTTRASDKSSIKDSVNTSVLPLIKLNNLQVDQSSIAYKDLGAGMDLSFAIGALETSIPLIDIDTARYDLSFLTVENTTAQVHMTTVSTPQPFVFEWPDMDVEGGTIKLTNNNFVYTLDNAVPQQGVFNPNALEIKDLNTQINDFTYTSKLASVSINSLTGKEISGLHVKDLASDLMITDKQMDLQDLYLHINNNRLTGAVHLDYPSIQELLENPIDISMDIAVPNFQINLEDIFLIQPGLRKNEYLLALSQRPITGSLKAKGSTENLNIPNLVINWGKETAVMAVGSLQNTLDTSSLSFELQSIKARTTRADVFTFIDTIDVPINLPERLSLTGTARGNLNEIYTDAALTTSAGSVTLDGYLKNSERISFNTTLQTSDLNLGLFLDNDQLGALDLKIETSGSGDDLNTLDAQVDGVVNKFNYNNYAIENLPFQATIQDGKGSFQTQYRDDNVNATLQSYIELDSIASQVNLKLDVTGVDLRALGITNRDIRTAGIINVYFKGDLDSFNATTTINDGIAVYNGQSYLLGTVDAAAFVNPDSTSVDINSRILDLQLQSNAAPQSLTTALKRHINRYLTEVPALDSVQPVIMRVDGNLRPTPILREVIVPSLQALDTVQIAVDFNEKLRKLNTDITAPYIKYAGSEIDSLTVNSRSDRDNLSFEIGYKNIEAGPINLDRTRFTGVVSNNELILDLLAYHKEEKLLHLGSSLSRKRDQNGLDNLIIKINLEDLILNKQAWRIPEDNSITVGNKILDFNNFVLTNANQKIELSSDLATVESNHVGLLFENFRLQSLLSYLNPDNKLATGAMNGNFVLEDLYNTSGFSADLQIEQLALLNEPLGNLNLQASSTTDSNYSMDLTLKGDQVDLDLSGSYDIADAATVDLQMQLNQLDLATVTSIAGDYLSDGVGQLSSNARVSGPISTPSYSGELHFDQAGFKVNAVNAFFSLDNETLTFNEEVISFDRFTVADAGDNTIVINGDVGTSSWLNPTFDLQLTAQNFALLNSTASDNDLYYGTARFNADARITGDLTIPVVDLDLTVLEDTDVTYVIPPTELDVIQRDGIVQFVNRNNPDAILTQTEEETATLSGYDITADLNIGKDAIINVIVDPDTGDNLQISGDGDLKLRMLPNGRLTLTGRYEINDGYYELSLYDIVTRRFEIAKGSSVSWAGDPFDALLDASAIYEVEASASALMASQTSGADAAVSQKFRQQLPFLVYLNVDGELMQPKISFSINMPEDEQGAIGGQVYGRLQQLNNQEQELNKQVFSLLVLNRFFPTSGADGSNGGTATIARDNINQALSDQLNQFGGQLLGDTGIDLNFGLDSYTDYQGNSPQDRTQLEVTASKKLLDDRLIVSVGSNVDVEGGAASNDAPAAVIGNVSLEYLITPSGRWRLKGFRRNEFDNVIDGQLIVSGIGVIFTREFNEFKNLFKQTIDEQNEELKKRQQSITKQNKANQKNNN